MAIEAAIGFERKLIVLDRMRDDWRLFGVIAHLAHIVSDRLWQRRRLVVGHRLAAAREARHDLRCPVGGEGNGGENERAAEYDAGQRATEALHAGTILTAHFLKSVCLEIGSVASS